MVAIGEDYGWKRFWYPRGENINLSDGGYLTDPDGPYSNQFSPDLRPFKALAELPCLVLLGEPGIGKSTTMRAERNAVDDAVRAEGAKTMWLDLRSCGSEARLVNKLFASQEFAVWLEGDHRLHLFLDSLDECLLRVDTVAALLVDELENFPVERLSLRIGCRTAEWPTSLLERSLSDLWGEENFGAYELAPLRRTDVASAAAVNGIDTEAFLEAVNEARAVPLAIKPVTLDFLLGNYAATGTFPSRQADLYLEGCRWLCEERNDSRVASGRTGELTPDQRLAAAARIAAVTVFSNKFAVWNGIQQADPEQEDVLVRTLAGGTEFVREDEFAVGEDAIREALGTALFSARGPEKLGWAHQTYAEFLAARYLVQRGATTEKAMSLLVHSDDQESRLGQHLHETAAWLASMSPEVFRTITDVDPEVLLRSDVASTDVEDKVTLVSTLLRLNDEGKLLDLGLVSPSQYRKLEHPDLAAQLRPYITDADKGIVVRRVAFDIAEACKLRALQDAAADVALDSAENLLVRKKAARFVAYVGNSVTRKLLKPLAVGEADNDLRGNGLRAVWPEHMSAEELFRSLKPLPQSYSGAYTVFLHRDLPERLRPGDLPAALGWVETQPSRHEMPLDFAKLMDELMLRGWEHLDVPGVREAFAKAAMARLRQYDEIVQERNSTFWASEEPSFQDRIAGDDEKRRSLVEEMLKLIEGEDDVWLLVRYKTRLVLKQDAAWLLDRLEGENSERERAKLTAVIRESFNSWDDEQHQLVYLAYQRNPALADEVGRFFDPVELSSELAEKQREMYEKVYSRSEGPPAHAVPDPPVAEMIVRALDDFGAGDVDAFWHLNYYMIFDEREFSKASEAAWDLRELPGWGAADSMTRARIVEAAERYVFEGDPRTDEWLEKGSPHRPALAGYRALQLLLNLSPDFVSELPIGTWERWIPAILDYPMTLGTGEEEPHLDLVAMAYHHSPGSVIDTTLSLVEKENENQDFLYVTRVLKKCWDDRLARILLEKAKDERLKPSFLQSLLEDLLAYGLDEARELAESIVAEHEGSECTRPRALAAAWALGFHANDPGWAVVWPTMQEDIEFGRQLVESIANGACHSGVPWEWLSEQQVADLYIWMTREYPHSEYYLPRGGGSIGHRENMGIWRDDILRHLQNRGTVEACRQIERIAAELPELQDNLKWTLYQARAETRRRTWRAPEPQHVLNLLIKRRARLVQNGDQLLEVVTASLQRLEAKLQGETPAAPDLWNERDDGAFRPKDEEAFSDYVKRHLQEDLEGRGVVVNREVVIRRGEGSGQGERTDVRVDAVVQDLRSDDPRADEHNTVTVIIEAKGCWYRRLYKEMEAQLADRYLRDNRCRHGLYLVGWFNCPQWDPEDRRQKTAARRELVKTQKRLEAKASDISQQGLRVEPLIINVALR